MNKSNTALQASHSSWHCVHNKLRDEWLDLMAEDIIIEDPIGVTPLDPVGKGHQGKEAVARFWDKNIAPNVIQIEAKSSYTGGGEAAHVMSLTTTAPSGHRAQVEGVFTYAVNDAGKIVAIRGYWEMSEIRLLGAA